MQNKLNVSKVVYPSSTLTQQEWMEEFKVSSGYIKPTPYFMGNELNFSVKSNGFSFRDLIHTLYHLVSTTF